MKKFFTAIFALCFLMVWVSSFAAQGDKTTTVSQIPSFGQYNIVAQSGKTAAVNPRVLISTSMGDIEAELYPDKAPITVKNFLDYVKDGFYDGLIFHRVIKGFMIQGGGFDADMKERSDKAPIKIESNNGLTNERGTLAMARTQDPNSATSQFFINHADNPFLNYKAATIAGYGYAVFGKVIKGMDVVDKIALVETGKKGFYSDVPLTPVIIKSIKVK